MITLGFLLSGGDSGGGGTEGYAPSSSTRRCVMYDSASVACVLVTRFEVVQAESYAVLAHPPW